MTLIVTREEQQEITIQHAGETLQIKFIGKNHQGRARFAIDAPKSFLIDYAKRTEPKHPISSIR